jgi:hypothetical protein
MATIQVPENSGSFLLRCIQFYDEMLNDIKLCKRKGLEKQAEIQCCFEISTNYIGRLSNDVKSYEFENIKDEIFFFKKLKPLFTAEAEFYTYQYHAELFKSTVEDKCPMEMELFYRRQLQRMTKFSREHPVFYNYVQEEKNCNDASWFTRDPEDRSRSSHDKLVSTYWAIKRYEEFVETELKGIGIDLSLSENEETNNP